MSSGSSQLSPEPDGWCHHSGFPRFHIWLQPPSRAPSPKDDISGLCTNYTTQAGLLKSLLNNHICPATLHPHQATGLRRLQPFSNKLPKSHRMAAATRAGFQCSIPKPHRIPDTVPFCLPGSRRASNLLQKGPLSSGARRLANEFLARHEESSGMLIVCWRISKRFGEIYTDFHVTATKVAQTLLFLYVGAEGGGCP